MLEQLCLDGGSDLPAMHHTFAQPQSEVGLQFQCIVQARELCNARCTAQVEVCPAEWVRDGARRRWSVVKINPQQRKTFQKRVVSNALTCVFDVVGCRKSAEPGFQLSNDEVAVQQDRKLRGGLGHCSC